MPETLDLAALERLAALIEKSDEVDRAQLQTPTGEYPSASAILWRAAHNNALTTELRNAAPALLALARAGLAARQEIARLSGILTTLERAVDAALEAAAIAQKRVPDGR